MSRFEQNLNVNPKIAAKKALFKSGISLAKPKAMKRTVTSKQLTLLLLGILVAIAVAFTLWINDPETQSSTHSSIFPNISPVAVKNIISSGIRVIFQGIL